MTTTFQVSFFVPGQPVAKGRPRVTRKGHAYTPRKTTAYEKLIATEAKRAMGETQPVSEAVSVCVQMWFKIPKSWPTKKRELAKDGALLPTVRPDADNVLKAVKDAMNGIVYRDDSQVVNGRFSKRYAVDPGVRVFVQEIL